MSYSASELKTKISAIIDWLSKEMSSIRTGRATIAILDGIKVDSYGVKTPISQVANMSIEDPKTIRIAPWDKGVIQNIEKSIQVADLGVSTVVDGVGLRVIFPELTSESRQKFIKLVWTKVEEAKVSVRGERAKANSDISAMEKEGGVSKDDVERLKDEVQKIVDESIKKIDEMGKNKESEMTL